ncbi:MAG: hypothetical protein WA628_13210 [Terriglobales bacterium]
MIRLPARMRWVWSADFPPGLRSKILLVWVALGFGTIVFLVSEVMHYLLVPDLGRHAERMVAEGVSAFIVGCLAAQLLRSALERRRVLRARLQVIEEMNHHIRNALTAISLSADTIQNRQSVRIISEGVEQIQWALCEILPRDRPVATQDRNRFFYFERRHKLG